MSSENLERPKSLICIAWTSRFIKTMEKNTNLATHKIGRNFLPKPTRVEDKSVTISLEYVLDERWRWRNKTKIQPKHRRTWWYYKGAHFPGDRRKYLHVRVFNSHMAYFFLVLFIRFSVLLIEIQIAVNLEAHFGMIYLKIMLPAGSVTTVGTLI